MPARRPRRVTQTVRRPRRRRSQRSHNDASHHHEHRNSCLAHCPLTFPITPAYPVYPIYPGANRSLRDRAQSMYARGRTVGSPQTKKVRTYVNCRGSLSSRGLPFLTPIPTPMRSHTLPATALAHPSNAPFIAITSRLGSREEHELRRTTLPRGLVNRGKGVDRNMTSSC